MAIDLPPTAIGKDYSDQFLAESPSNSGFILGYKGILSLMLSSEEGVEFNLGGAVYGIDLSPLAIKLPAVGRIELNSLKLGLYEKGSC